MSQAVTDFDIVPVTPQVDLVLFDNVLSCYPCNRDLTATYTLGEAVQQSTWDWVGLFRCSWRYLGEYVSYRWACSWSSDVTAPRRRSVCFPSSMIETQEDWCCEFQLLYVSDGNHVTGVSRRFRMCPPETVEDFNIASLFVELPIPLPPANWATAVSGGKTIIKKKGKAVKRSRDRFGEVSTPDVIPAKRPCGKEKIIKIFKDSETLFNIPSTSLGGCLNIVQLYSDPADEKPSSQLVPRTDSRALKLFDVQWNKKDSTRHQLPIFASFDVNANILPIEYPSFLSLKTGPIAFLESIRNQQGACSNCGVAKTLVSDLAHTSGVLENKLAERLATDARNNQEQNNKDSFAVLTAVTSKLNDWHINKLEGENAWLRERVEQLEIRANARLASEQDELTHSLSTDWLVWEPRKIVRLRKMLYKQQCAIEALKTSVDSKNIEIITLRAKIRDLQTLIKIADNASEKFQTLAEELNVQIKGILSKRAKDHTNEWRQFVREFQERTTQTPPPSPTTTSSTSPEPLPTTRPRPGSSGPTATTSTSTSNSATGNNNPTNSGAAKQRHAGAAKSHLKNKHMSKVLKCESQPKSKLHKERAQAEQCPTCGLKFSLKADRRVIEEHLVYHTRHRKHD